MLGLPKASGAACANYLVPEGFGQQPAALCAVQKSRGAFLNPQDVNKNIPGLPELRFRPGLRHRGGGCSPSACCECQRWREVPPGLSRALTCIWWPLLHGDCLLLAPSSSYFHPEPLPFFPLPPKAPSSLLGACRPRAGTVVLCLSDYSLRRAGIN